AYTPLLLASFAEQNSLRKHMLRVLATFSVLKSELFEFILLVWGFMKAVATDAGERKGGIY
ncbi:hypothetical protein, partial [Paenibacillus sp. OSY-SE]|uniref:hypothetical protein n=1 Tax=Paenibacillus sp. OSY-SE TaxID=1196323 RepID=UPI0005654F01